MATFVEKTLAEQGFGTSWTRHVAPVLEQQCAPGPAAVAFAIVATSGISLVAGGDGHRDAFDG